MCSSPRPSPRQRQTSGLASADRQTVADHRPLLVPTCTPGTYLLRSIYGRALRLRAPSAPRTVSVNVKMTPRVRPHPERSTAAAHGTTMSQLPGGRCPPVSSRSGWLRTPWARCHPCASEDDPRMSHASPRGKTPSTSGCARPADSAGGAAHARGVWRRAIPEGPEHVARARSPCGPPGRTGKVPAGAAACGARGHGGRRWAPGRAPTLDA